MVMATIEVMIIPRLYQVEPHSPFSQLLPVGERLPLPDIEPV